ncbi:IclR family transcriptional regulator [Kocuria sp. CPCC 205258]|uniref:IclR family transcriptional regulator n=1 Tax=Kocuria sp. CPCC 205258 TaxID=3073552 RepID=UPI0034D65525
MARTQSGESVLSRAVRLVEAFRQGEEWLTVTELARRTGLHLATASRLVAELTEHGWLERDEERRVRLGVRLWEVAARASSALSLREAAMPVLEDLHAQVRQHAQIGVLDGTEVLFLERLSAPDAVVNFTRIAGRLSLHASSSGLVLLAHSGAAFQEEVLAGPHEAFTDSTPTDPERLRRMLALIRRDGSAHCPGYLHPDATGIAAPVFRRGEAVATLSVVVPNLPRSRQWEPLLRIAAATVTRRLDGTG